MNSKEYKSHIIIFAIAIICYYIIPATGYIIGHGLGKFIGLTCLMFVNPVFCAISGFMLANKKKERSMPVVLALFFFPALILFYNISAWRYLLIYTLAGYLGLGISKVFRMKIK